MKNDRLNSREDTMKEILQPYLRNWMWFLAGAALFSVIGYFIIKSMPPVYETVTKILIKDAKKSNGAADIAAMQGLSGFSGMSSNSVENEMEVLSSKKLLYQIAEDLPLQITLYSKGTFHNVELYKAQSPVIVQVINEKPYAELPKKMLSLKISGSGIEINSDELQQPIKSAFGKTISLPYANIMVIRNPHYDRHQLKDVDDANDLLFSYRDQETVVNDLQEQLNVSLSNNDATVINLILHYQNKNKAKDILNNLVKKYNNDAIAEKNTESEKTKLFIDDRVKLISRELGDVEAQKENFKASNNIVDIPAQTGINLQKSTEAEKRRLDLSTQLELNNMYLNYLGSKSSTEMLPANIGLENGAAVGAISAYNQLIADRNRLLANATEDNPLVESLDNQITTLRRGIRESLMKSRTNLLTAIGSISSLENKSNIGLNKVPAQERLFRNIERQQQIKESLYLVLLQKREETAITLAMSSDKARVLDLAYSKRKPVSPAKPFILGASLLLGLALPFLVIFLRRFFNTKVLQSTDVSGITDIPVVAEIPHLMSKKSSLIEHNDVSGMAEAFRILATNLNLILPVNKAKDKTVLVTSSVKGEGKTFISVNLALSIAKPGKRVLVIGSDIRNPQLQRYRPDMVSAPGVTEFLYGSITDVHEIIHPSTFNEHCDFIFSGVIPPNPVDLLENGNYARLLEQLQGIYEYIVIDSAPLMPVTDTYIINHLADAILYVVRSEKTEKSYIQYADEVAREKLKNISFVLNDVKQAQFGYGNKHGYGYQQTQKKSFFFGKN